MSKKEDVDQKADEIIKEAIERFKKVGGTVEERMDLAEAMITELTKNQQNYVRSTSYLSESIKILADALKSLKERMVVVEEALTTIYKAATPSFSSDPGSTPSPKDQN